MRARVAGPPEDHGQLGLEQRPHGPRDEVDGIRSRAKDDPLGADLRPSRRRQVAERRDLGRDPTPGVVRPAQHDRPAGVLRDDGLEHPAQRLAAPGQAPDHQVRQGDPRDVRVLQLRPPRLLRRRPPELRQLRLDLPRIDRDPLPARNESVIASGIGRSPSSRSWRLPGPGLWEFSHRPIITWAVIPAEVAPSSSSGQVLSDRKPGRPDTSAMRSGSSRPLPILGRIPNGSAGKGVRNRSRRGIV